MQVLVEHISCIITEPELEETLKLPYGEIYVLTGEGRVFKHIKLRGNRSIRVEVDSVPNYKSALSEEINFLPAGKISYDIFEQLIQFFKSVMAVKKSDLEAMAHVLWNPTDGYHIAVPNQVISKASVTYDWEGYLKPEDIIILDIHSHNTMGAFFSGTDNADDKKGFYYSGVVGQLDKIPHAAVFRFNVHDLKRPAKLDEIFEVPHKEISINQEWLDRVKAGNQMVPYSSGHHFPKSNKHYVPSTYSPGPVRQIGSNGRYKDQSEFPGFDRDDEGSLWRHLAERDMSEQGVNSDISPKTLATRDEKKTGWNPTVEVEVVRKAKKEATSIVKVKPKDLSPGEDDYILAQYGEDILDSKQSAEAWIDDLEGCDELIDDIIRYAFDKLSEAAQAKFMTQGL